MRGPVAGVVVLVMAAGGAGCAPVAPRAADEAGGARTAVDRAVDRVEDGDLELVLADGAEVWGDRQVPWVLHGSIPEDAIEACVGNSPQSCQRWSARVASGTWIAPVRPGEHTAHAWLRTADGAETGPITATLMVDELAPEDGAVSVAATAGGLELSWTGFTDEGTGVAGYRAHLGEGVSAPGCDATAAPAWEGTETAITLTGLPEAPHAVRLCAVDGAGNTSEGVLVRATPLADGAAPVVEHLVLSGGLVAVATREVTLDGQVHDTGSDVWFCASETAESATECLAWRPWSDGVAHDLNTDEGSHTLQVWFRDLYGNTTDAVSDSIVVDRSPPTGGTLELAADGGRISMSWSDFSDAHTAVDSYVVVWDETWAPARCSEGTEIHRGDETSLLVDTLPGARWVGVRVCAVDTLGHVSGGANARVRIDEEGDPPVVHAFTLNGGEPLAWQREVDVDITASDVSGVSRMCLSTDAGACSGWSVFAASRTFTLPSAPGEHTVFLWLEDGEGNQSASPSAALVAWRAPEDGDGDGVDERTDCDDADPERSPLADERCDGIDNNCDGMVDGPDAVDPPGWYLDEDGDGYGDPASELRQCADPGGRIMDGTDCNDRYAVVHPEAGCGVPRNCQDLLGMGYTESGAYTVGPSGEGSFASVVCDQEEDGGGWTRVVGWDAAEGDGMDELFGSGAPFVVERNSMEAVEMREGGLAWCGGDEAAEGRAPGHAGMFALSLSLAVPHDGELRAALEHRGPKTGAARLHLSAEWEGGQDPVWCAATGRGTAPTATGQAARPSVGPIGAADRCDDDGEDVLAEIDASTHTLNLIGRHAESSCRAWSRLDAIEVWVR